MRNDNSKLIRVAVKILPRAEVLDSQGRAVLKTLSTQNSSILECRVGRYVILDFSTGTLDVALESARKMAESVLHNPLIETFELEVLSRM